MNGFPHLSLTSRYEAFLVQINLAAQQAFIIFPSRYYLVIDG